MNEPSALERSRSVALRDGRCGGFPKPLDNKKTDTANDRWWMAGFSSSIDKYRDVHRECGVSWSERAMWVPWTQFTSFFENRNTSGRAMVSKKGHIVLAHVRSTNTTFTKTKAWSNSARCLLPNQSNSARIASGVLTSVHETYNWIFYFKRLICLTRKLRTEKSAPGFETFLSSLGKTSRLATLPRGQSEPTFHETQPIFQTPLCETLKPLTYSYFNHSLAWRFSSHSNYRWNFSFRKLEFSDFGKL